MNRCDHKSPLRTIFMVLFLLACETVTGQPIDRQALVNRNSPMVTTMDTLSSLSVGNGEFAMTVDATGLQTFPEFYSRGVCLGTQSQWGWHSMPNTEDYRPEEVLKPYNLGHHSTEELYSCQFRDAGRQHDASEYLRMNPHRLHLGCLGFDFDGKIQPSDIHDIHQCLDLWEGVIHSHFTFDGKGHDVQTVCHPTRDMIAVRVISTARTPISLRLPYPTARHTDDGCDWTANDAHQSAIVQKDAHRAVVRHQLDSTTYYIIVRWKGQADFNEKSKHHFVLSPVGNTLEITVEWVPEYSENSEQINSYRTVRESSASRWRQFWTEGAAVDFSHCLDPRAKELERRVVLSQYLLAIQSAGSRPPQETGLTFNSWFGKFHLEMILWHEAWLPLWGHADMLTKALSWYPSAQPMAREIARRQGFDGIRWMKMTDPSGAEAPSNVGSFLIWQQPHLIYLCELAYRSTGDNNLIAKYAPLIDETATFMYSFANYDSSTGRYILRGLIPAQESLKADVTFNPPFELSQWLTTMEMAQQWRVRAGKERKTDWDDLIQKLSPLAFNDDSLYLAAESATDTYTNLKGTSDHPAMLGALGFFPESRLINPVVMSHTLDWVFVNWNWPTAWGWDFPMMAMTATRLHQPEMAIQSLLKSEQKNTYLNNGHNYQDGRLRIYLPGNGGLLSAIALMCAGWDGCPWPNPGFPDDGNWDVRWEGLQPLI